MKISFKHIALYMVLILFTISPLTVKAQSAAEMYEKAYSQLRQGVNAAEVLRLLDDCIKKDRKFEKAYMLRAFVFYKLEDYDAAIRDYSALLLVNPLHDEALISRALAKLQVYDVEGAISDHTQRIKNNPLNEVAYFDRAYCKGLIFDVEGAIADYSKAISLNLNYKEALTNRGIARMNLATSKDLEQRNMQEMENACEDIQRAYTLGDYKVINLLEQYCSNN